LVVTPFGRRAHHALGDLSSRRGIPGLLISHASFSPTKNDLEEMEWRFHGYGLFHGSYSHAALQTPVAADFASQLSSPARFVPTGPLVWGRAVNPAASERLKTKMLAGREQCRVVVHAGTAHGRGSIHFHVYETMDEYVQALADLVTAMDQVPDAFLIIKAKPVPLTEDELRSLLPQSNNYCISVEEPFLDVLGLSDLLVSFASTTIEEALQNRVPVLLYGGEGRYRHVAALEVTPDTDVEPRAVYAVARPEHLAEGIRRILDINGKAPLPAELFRQYVYRPEDITPFPQLVRQLVDS
jgi:DNA-directed RNA polymerase subunit F